MGEKKANLKRRDKKGRVLRMGENQRKDGRYAYVYTDSFGKQKFVYSWKLEPTDPLPAGCRPCVALRVKEQEIQRDMCDGIIPNGGDMTVKGLLQKYISMKITASESSKSVYSWIIKSLDVDPFGNIRIDKIKKSDAKLWYINMRNEEKKYKTISTIHNVVKPAFKMAVEDDWLRKNPFDFKLSEVIQNDTEKKQVLSEEQKANFLDFIKNDNCFNKYYDAVFLLFNTGMRISELCGLTFKDIDLEKRIIHIDHQLLRDRNMHYFIDEPKSRNGIRDIPMTDEVYACLKRIIWKRKKIKIEPMIDGYSGFLFLSRNNDVTNRYVWDMRFSNMKKKYNSESKQRIVQLTPHVCRHTFCTNMAKCGMNPKILQYIMGHADIAITMNYYTHINGEDAKEELKRIEKIG